LPEPAGKENGKPYWTGNRYSARFFQKDSIYNSRQKYANNAMNARALTVKMTHML